MNKTSIQINDHRIGPGERTFVIAEVSANHNQDIRVAKDLIGIAKESGADAVKIQTYTADTMTIDSDKEWFQIGAGTVWEGRNLHDLYGEAYTPWEWHAELFAHAAEVGITMFSTPFDLSSVDLLETLDVPAYKVASFELIDHPLLRKIASTSKPVIMSTGMASLSEIADAVGVLRDSGCQELVLLKCTSSYPAPADEANLARIPHMAQAFNVPVGLSDHTMGSTVPAVAVGLGACVIEKHFTKSRDVEGPDSAFSMEPQEFADMVAAVRIASSAVGEVTYDLTEKEKANRVFRRSIFVSEDVAAGEMFTEENVRIIRPGHGLPPADLPLVLGRVAKADIERGTPLSWDLL